MGRPVSDTLALGLINEGIGMGLPIVALSHFNDLRVGRYELHGAAVRAEHGARGRGGKVRPG
ncbi:hypothetical protein [Streptomyces mirabilis]|uniref:hypothetical protein n=1 Tax=Streptomyces mirabilis TaxID=68239 RepID=UPI0036C8529A